MLDFGLAKVWSAAVDEDRSSDLSQSLTMPRASTDAGVILGFAIDLVDITERDPPILPRRPHKQVVRHQLAAVTEGSGGAGTAERNEATGGLGFDTLLIAFFGDYRGKTLLVVGDVSSATCKEVREGNRRLGFRGRRTNAGSDTRHDDSRSDDPPECQLVVNDVTEPCAK